MNSSQLSDRANTVEHVTVASPARVWEVLADGWTYPLFVVGASRMRAVSADWPAVGAKLHHSAGTWPAVIDDETTVLELEPGRRLLLEPKGRPVGRAHVEIVLEPHPVGTLIRMSEDVSSGPTRLVPKPARAAGIRLRNRETLTRLAFVAERPTQP